MANFPDAHGLSDDSLRGSEDVALRTSNDNRTEFIKPVSEQEKAAAERMMRTQYPTPHLFTPNPNVLPTGVGSAQAGYIEAPETSEPETVQADVPAPGDNLNTVPGGRDIDLVKELDERRTVAYREPERENSPRYNDPDHTPKPEPERPPNPEPTENPRPVNLRGPEDD